MGDRRWPFFVLGILPVAAWDAVTGDWPWAAIDVGFATVLSLVMVCREWQAKRAERRERARRDEIRRAMG